MANFCIFCWPTVALPAQYYNIDARNILYYLFNVLFKVIGIGFRVKLIDFVHWPIHDSDQAQTIVKIYT